MLRWLWQHLHVVFTGHSLARWLAGCSNTTILVHFGRHMFGIFRDKAKINYYFTVICNPSLTWSGFTLNPDWGPNNCLAQRPYMDTKQGRRTGSCSDDPVTLIVAEVVVWIVGSCERLFTGVHFTLTARFYHQHKHRETVNKLPSFFFTVLPLWMSLSPSVMTI